MSATEEFRRVVANGTNDVGGVKEDNIVSNGSAVPRDIAGAMTCADDLPRDQARREQAGSQREPRHARGDRGQRQGRAAPPRGGGRASD